MGTEKNTGSLVSMDSAEFKEDEAQNEVQIEEQSKRKASKDLEISFEVTRELVNPRKKTYSLKVIKPTNVSIGVNTYPSVCLMEESSDNKHAFYIMHNLNHKNVLSLKVLAKNKMTKDTSSVAAFVELHSGKLWSILEPDACVDRVKHVPSKRLQNFLRDIVIAIDFLRKNDCYHGNLSWKTTLYLDDMVKLAGFRVNDSEDPNWNDWLCFVEMLEDISERVKISNNTRLMNYSTGSIDSLIDMLKTLDRTSLLTIKDTVLEHSFFLDITQRVEFFAHNVSLKLTDPEFLKRVRDSNICQKPWDKNCTLEFKNLVTKMNDHRETEEKKRGQKNRDANEKGVRYEGNSSVDYVRCVCGAYTHWKQIGLAVDDIVRENHPTMFVDMKRVFIGTSNSLASGSTS